MGRARGIQPTADRFTREEPVRERADEQTTATYDARNVAEHLHWTREVVDRDATRRAVERIGGERERRVGVQVVHNPRRRLWIGGELRGVHPEHRQRVGLLEKVRD